MTPARLLLPLPEPIGTDATGWTWTITKPGPCGMALPLVRIDFTRATADFHRRRQENPENERPWTGRTARDGLTAAELTELTQRLERLMSGQP